MEGTVKISLTEYVELADTVKQLQSQVEKYAEQIQKEQLECAMLHEWAIEQESSWVNPNDKEKGYVVRSYRRAKLIELGITNKEIDAYLEKKNL